ncbi:hypothetical protein ERJ75_001452600 [Trypanosoma vivax]|uniref:Uncharacterized protein n=1 Tax=Trypanosoma vivax (strain Y486) TaxID=1055687 RepID=G0TW33_TRYVY|nr:hypothetical protein ERJ75_001452600 [Trypanosoma vivax]CCC48149.1 conserved hypothetical protein [Trypanosoma vivax Y486]
MEVEEDEHSVEEDVNEINSTLFALQDSLTCALREYGVLGKLRAQLRASVMSIMRVDPDLRGAVVGDVMRPCDIPLERRIALLLIHDFVRVHGLKLTASVFEEEANLEMVNKEECTALLGHEGLRRGGAPSAIEAVIVRAIGGDVAADHGVFTSSPVPPSPAPPGNTAPIQPAVRRDEDEKASCDTAERVEYSEQVEDGEDDLKILLHAGVAAGLNEYEDSVAFSDASVEDISFIDSQAYDFVDRF